MDRLGLQTQTSPSRPARWEIEEKEEKEEEEEGEEKKEEEEEGQAVAFHSNLCLNRFVYCLFTWNVSTKQQYAKHVFEIELY